MSEDNKESAFESDFNALQDWPHSLTAIEDTLDIDLIEGRATQQLYRALSNRTLVGFIGSGVSAAYGRMSWSQLQQKQTDDIRNVAEKFTRLSGSANLWLGQLLQMAQQSESSIPSDNGINDSKILSSHLSIKADEIDYQRREIEKLKTTYDALNDSHTTLGGDIYPIQFQLAKRLMDALQRAEKIFIIREPTLDMRRGQALRHEESSEFRKRCKFGYAADHGDRYLLQDRIYRAIGNRELDNFPAYRRFKRDFKGYFRALCRRGVSLRFKDNTKYLLYDESAHAEYILYTAMEYSVGAGRERWRSAQSGGDGQSRAQVWAQIADHFPEQDPARLTRDIKTISSHPGNFQVLGFFKKDAVIGICDHFSNSEQNDHQAHPAWTNIVQLIRNTTESGRSPAFERTIWTPTRRFIVSMLFARLQDPLNTDFFLQNYFEKIEKTDYRARYSLIHEDMDPLLHMSMDLGIKHYLTTNYDLEVERLFSDRGYEITRPVGNPETSNQRGRDDRVGGRSLDATFKRRETADLVSFSLDLESADNSVFHLHGRATADSEIVLTERDYMNLYLLNDRYRDSIDEAIDLAFSANPVLFVGLGMSEGDVLRPMRQFVSDQERRWDRTAIALMPAIGPLQQRRTDAATLYMRYGALTIYFGDALVDGERFEWLMIINAIGEALRKYTSAIKLALIHVRRYHDRLDHPTALKEDFDERSHSFYNELVESLNFLRRHVTVDKNPSNQSTRASRRNAWLVQECTKLGDAVNSHESLKSDFQRDLNRFLVEFDCENFRPLIETHGAESGRDAKPDIAFELSLLNNLRDIALDFTLNSSALNHPLQNPGFDEVISTLIKLDIDQINALIRDCRAVEIGLDGCLSSIHTAVLSSFLRNLNASQKHWLKTWQDRPFVRKPRLEIKPYSAPPCKHCGGAVNNLLAECSKCQQKIPADSRHASLPVRYIRHHIENTFTRLEDNWTKDSDYYLSKAASEISSGQFTGVRAYDTFLDSLEQILPDDDNSLTSRCRRRVFLVAAHRGLGKGVFLSAMASGLGIEGFIRNSWQANQENPEQLPIHYRSAIFINYSFSTEIASTWDMIIDTMINTCAEVQADKKQSRYPNQAHIPRVFAAHRNHYTSSSVKKFATSSIFKKYQTRVLAFRRKLEQLTRVQKLRYLFGKWKQLNNDQPERILLCLSAVDLLYSDDGVAKNAEIAAMMEVFLADEFRDCPVDLVFVCEEASIPAVFRPEEYPDAEPNKSPSSHNRIHQLITRTDVSVYGLRRIEQRMSGSGLHTRYLSDSDITIQCALGPDTDTTGRYVHFCRVMQPEIFLIDNFDILASILFLGHLVQDDTYLTAAQKHQLCNGYAQIYASYKSSLYLGSRREHRGILRDFLLAQVCELGENLLTDSERQLRSTYENLSSAILRSRYDPPEPGDNSEQHRFDRGSYRGWREIRKRLRHNRFSFTILLAAAEQLAVTQATITEAKGAAEDFIEAVVNNTGTVSAERREEVLVQDVLHLHERFHRAGDPVRDIDLHFSILRHLAVIGQPCSPDVLVRLPEIRDYFDRNSANRRHSRIAYSESYPQRRTGELIRALDQLERSGLVFKLTAHPLLATLDEYNQENSASYRAPDRGEPTRDLHRYALHRLIHRHVVRKMGGPLKEFVATNNFAATLYASMPSELPRPTLATYQFLRQLVSSLSGYPDRYMLDNPTEPWHFNTAMAHTRIQALRSALGILRSTFSIAVVSRFEEYQDGNDGGNSNKWMSHAGYFEEHRIQVRWLLRQASCIGAKITGNDSSVIGPEWIQNNMQDEPGHLSEGDSERTLNAFYHDEIIWLYNEAGVICLVQGNLLDAVNLFRHALLCNREIEGFEAEDGAQHCRISLNLAVAQIERGRLTSAAARLDSITSHRQQGTELHALATGYRALVHHLRGERDLAIELYHAALEVTRSLQDYRASSIFCRHCGDLYRLRDDNSKAHQYIEDAIAFAESGGHEDLHKKALLSKIKQQIRSDSTPPVPVHLHLLRQIESYAETMDMPTLHCEAMHIRARILLDQGETTLAGKLLQKTIAKAKRNGLQLRMSSALTLYGKVMQNRDQRETGKKLLLTALEMTKTLGIQIEIDRIERQLNTL